MKSICPSHLNRIQKDSFNESSIKTCDKLKSLSSLSLQRYFVVKSVILHYYCQSISKRTYNPMFNTQFNTNTKKKNKTKHHENTSQYNIQCILWMPFSANQSLTAIHFQFKCRTLFHIMLVDDVQRIKLVTRC